MHPVNILAMALLGGAEAVALRPVLKIPVQTTSTSVSSAASSSKVAVALRPGLIIPAKATTTSTSTAAFPSTTSTSTATSSSTVKTTTSTTSSTTIKSTTTSITSTTTSTTVAPLTTSVTSTTISTTAKPTTTSTTSTVVSTTAQPTTTSTTSTTVSTTAKPSSTTLTTTTSTTSSAAAACTSSYYQYGCLPLTNDAVFVNTMLKQHNNYRARHNAPAMTWSSDLAAAALVNAQNNADKNIFVHTSNNPNGENIAYQYGWNNPEYLGFLWYDEEKKFDFTNGGFADATGHFTQMVWQSSTQLGCAYVQAKNSLPNNGYYYLSCEYRTPGNYDGEYRSQVLAPNSQAYPTAPPQWL